MKRGDDEIGRKLCRPLVDDSFIADGYLTYSLQCAVPREGSAFLFVEFSLWDESEAMQ